ncbi:MAG: hypothetical protein FWG83_01360 [Oscillospiraceae bacterium]|nr:hypothetical protein [Oscillospiraceae bacterium]
MKRFLTLIATAVLIAAVLAASGCGKQRNCEVCGADTKLMSGDGNQFICRDGCILDLIP